MVIFTASLVAEKITIAKNFLNLFLPAPSRMPPSLAQLPLQLLGFEQILPLIGLLPVSSMARATPCWRLAALAWGLGSRACSNGDAGGKMLLKREIGSAHQGVALKLLALH